MSGGGRGFTFGVGAPSASSSPVSSEGDVRNSKSPSSAESATLPLTSSIPRDAPARINAARFAPRRMPSVDAAAAVRASQSHPPPTPTKAGPGFGGFTFGVPSAAAALQRPLPSPGSDDEDAGGGGGARKRQPIRREPSASLRQAASGGGAPPPTVGARLDALDAQMEHMAADVARILALVEGVGAQFEAERGVLRQVTTQLEVVAELQRALSREGTSEAATHRRSLDSLSASAPVAAAAAMPHAHEHERAHPIEESMARAQSHLSESARKAAHPGRAEPLTPAEVEDAQRQDILRRRSPAAEVARTMELLTPGKATPAPRKNGRGAVADTPGGALWDTPAGTLLTPAPSSTAAAAISTDDEEAVAPGPSPLDSPLSSSLSWSGPMLADSYSYESAPQGAESPTDSEGFSLLTALPYELQARVLRKWLPDGRDRLALLLSCRSLQALSTRAELWEHLDFSDVDSAARLSRSTSEGGGGGSTEKAGSLSRSSRLDMWSTVTDGRLAVLLWLLRKGGASGAVSSIDLSSACEISDISLIRICGTGGLGKAESWPSGKRDSKGATLEVNCAALRGLQSIRLRGCTRLSSEACSTFVERLPGLRTIDLGGCAGALSDATVHRLMQACSSQSTPGVDVAETLEELCLRGGRELGQASVQHLGGRCVNLRSLDLSGCVRLLTDKSIQKLAPSLPQLEHINLSRGWMLLDGHESRSANVNMAGARDFTDASLILLGAHCFNLVSADFGWCRALSDDGVFRLVRKCKRLERLSLRHCDALTSVSCQHLATELPRLLHLDLGECKRVTDKGIHAIAEGTTTTLQSLDIRGCQKVNEAAVEAVARGCPSLRSLSFSCSRPREHSGSGSGSPLVASSSAAAPSPPRSPGGGKAPKVHGINVGVVGVVCTARPRLAKLCLEHASSWDTAALRQQLEQTGRGDLVVLVDGGAAHLSQLGAPMHVPASSHPIVRSIS